MPHYTNFGGTTWDLLSKRKKNADLSQTKKTSNKKGNDYWIGKLNIGFKYYKILAKKTK